MDSYQLHTRTQNGTRRQISWLVLLYCLTISSWLATSYQTSTSATLQAVALAASSGALSLAPDWISSEMDATSSVAWGDVDNDGDLDLAVGNGIGPNRVYRNEHGMLIPAAIWSSRESGWATSVAWGDVDGDGDLDLAIGNNGQPNRLYMNVGGQLQEAAVWSSVESDNTYSVAWGDVDGDGDLDLAVGNTGQPNRLYVNSGGQLQVIAAWNSTENDNTYSVAWGDMDGDGDLDLATGNDGRPNRVYANQGGRLQVIAAWSSTENDNTHSVAWGDVDGDGDLDLATGNNGQPNRVYMNEAGRLQVTASWSSVESDDTYSVAWGDADGDGDLDLAAGNAYLGNRNQPNRIYINEGTRLQTTAAWSSVENDTTYSVAWGDMDSDGNLDLAVGNAGQSNRIYLNKGERLQTAAAWSSVDSDRTMSVAWGDVDNDNDLDLAVGNDNQPNRVYTNEAGRLQATAAWSSVESDRTMSVAWGDVDGDGDLDLAAGNNDQPNRVYINEGGRLQTTAAWSSVESDRTMSVAWGDVDGDGDLDLAVGNLAQSNRVYLNAGGRLQATPAWSSTERDWTTSVAWGDVDGDGDLDLAIGNNGQPNRIYLNDKGQLPPTAAWSSSDINWTTSVAWGDADGDSDLDLAVGNNGQPNHIYFNDKGELAPTPAWSSVENDGTSSIAWGDVDGNGSLDLVAGNNGQPNRLYINDKGQLPTSATWNSLAIDGVYSVAWGDVDNDGDFDLAAGHRLYLNLQSSHALYAQPIAALLHLQSDATPTFNGQQANNLAPANFYAVPGIRQAGAIPLTYNLFHPTREQVGQIQVYYTLDGSFSNERSQWHIAKPLPNTQTDDLSSSPYPTPTIGNTHVFTWDVFESGFFGQSDNVVVRLEALPNLKPVRNGIPGPFQRPFVATQTFPFRVRGNQVRVVNGANPAEPLAGAIVYHLAARQLTDAKAYVDLRANLYRTNTQGYLQGHGNLMQGDRLIALWPIATTSKYTVYQTSAAVTSEGLDAFTVTQPGVQTLTVSPENTLILFDLTVSLEWDARNDPTFMAQLENDLRRTSQILYDLTNGQVALGQVRIYHDKEFWGESDIVISASNSQRPSAIMGGSVLTATADIGVNGQLLPDAYVPGQVRMGPTWNRFGNPSGTLGEDWPRALAHELGHYLLFQADNYIGLSPEGRLLLVECEGSAMTEPYEEANSEFLTKAEWKGDCLNTVANRYLGRADWETITRFYPKLNGSRINPGPSQLPLAVTHIETFAPATMPNTLADPFFHLVDNANHTLAVSDGQGQVYLFKRWDNNDPTDDYLIAEGVPIGDLVQARGAAPGDRLCVFDYGHPRVQLGCTVVGTAPTPVTLATLPDWKPKIQVIGVTSTTVVVTVTNVSEDKLNVQLLPALGASSGAVPMTRIGTDFVQTVSSLNGAFYGYVRVWVPNSTPLKEMITEYIAVEAWSGRGYMWGGRAYAWGGRAYAWGAPTMSGDGQVSIFSMNNLFGGNADFTLQSVAFTPNFPVWLTPVGQTYQVNGQTTLADSAILFRYLARDVPDGYEDSLCIYYSPDAGQSWQRLATQLNTAHNYASAPIQGKGIYALVATVKMPPFAQGWNLLGYPVQTAQPVATALASIAGSYRAVYQFNPNHSITWRLFDPSVPVVFSPLVNTLTQLEPNSAYWLYLTQPITLYLHVAAGDNIVKATSVNAVATAPAAPATYYGWLIPTVKFTPSEGMRVLAEIDGAVCGEATVRIWDGKFAYVVQVAAFDLDRPAQKCGIPGKTVLFRVGGQLMNGQYLWDNHQAWFNELGVGLFQSLYLPLIRK